MSNRPAIAIEIRREVLFEARHRCAVCCDPTPLEQAHIIAWSKSKDHRVLRSYIQGDDGKWTQFMTAHYRRKK